MATKTNSKDADAKGTETATADEAERGTEDFVATETGKAPTAEDYLGDGEFTSDAPILQGSPHYYKGRLLTTQEELDAARKEEFEELKKGAPEVVKSERNKDSDSDKK